MDGDSVDHNARIKLSEQSDMILALEARIANNQSRIFQLSEDIKNLANLVTDLTNIIKTHVDRDCEESV